MVTLAINIPMDKIATLCREFGVRELSVFGSALRDDFRSDSDVDLLVLFEPTAKIGLIGYLELQERLSEILGRKVDLVSKSGLNPFLRDEVLSSSLVIYGSE